MEETIRFVQQIDPDCAGAALGIRLYPGTFMHGIVAAEGPWETNAAITPALRWPGRSVETDVLRLASSG